MTRSEVEWPFVYVGLHLLGGQQCFLSPILEQFYKDWGYPDGAAVLHLPDPKLEDLVPGIVTEQCEKYEVHFNREEKKKCPLRFDLPTLRSPKLNHMNQLLKGHFGCFCRLAKSMVIRIFRHSYYYFLVWWGPEKSWSSDQSYFLQSISWVFNPILLNVILSLGIWLKGKNWEPANLKLFGVKCQQTQLEKINHSCADFGTVQKKKSQPGNLEWRSGIVAFIRDSERLAPLSKKKALSETSLTPLVCKARPTPWWS